MKKSYKKNLQIKEKVGKIAIARGLYTCVLFVLKKAKDQNPIYLVQFVHSSLFLRRHLYKFSEPSCFCSRYLLSSERNV